MKITIINGPNLNLLGVREPGIYGNRRFDDYLDGLRRQYKGVAEIEYFQSHVEGGLIDQPHHTGLAFKGLGLNPRAYTHTSLAIADAISAIPTPVVEVHISNVHRREPVRHHSMISAACAGVIAGFGLDSYRLAIEALLAMPHTADCKK